MLSKNLSYETVSIGHKKSDSYPLRSDQDLARFTTLVRTDHSNEQAESEAKKTLEDSEARVDHQFTSEFLESWSFLLCYPIQHFPLVGMMQAILTRYHEEQVWSDKVRRYVQKNAHKHFGIFTKLFILDTSLIDHIFIIDNSHQRTSFPGRDCASGAVQKIQSGLRS